MWNQDEEAKEQEHIAVELNSVEEQQLSEIIREQTEKFKRSVTHKRQASTKFQDWAPGDVTYINLFCDGKMHRFGKASVMHTLWFFFVDLMIVLPLFVASVSSFVDAQSISAKFTTALKLNNMIVGQYICCIVRQFYCASHVCHRVIGNQWRGYNLTYENDQDHCAWHSHRH